MKNILLSSFSFLVLQLGVAQDSQLYNEPLKTIDSLEAKLMKSAADTNRVKILLALVDAQALKKEKAVYYGSQAVELAQKLGNKNFESASLRRLAIVLQTMGQQSQAITHL